MAVPDSAFARIVGHFKILGKFQSVGRAGIFAESAEHAARGIVGEGGGSDGEDIAGSAVAGGLVVWDDRGPCFCADAVGDPVTGLAATAAVLEVLDAGADAVVEASMADAAAGLLASPHV